MSTGRVRSATVVLVDTSALCADPEVLDAFGPVSLCVPVGVIGDLDRLKGRQDATGAAARDALRRLEALRVGGGDLVGGVELPSGARLRIVEGDGGVALLHRDDVRAGARIATCDLSLRLRAAAAGVEVAEWSQSPAWNPGWDEIELAPEQMAELRHRRRTRAPAGLADNRGVLARCGTASVLARTKAGELVTIRHRNVRGLRPRSREQHFALELLCDPDVGVVALDGPAGTGKSILAIAAGLAQCLDDNRYDRVMILRPMLSVAGQDIGFLPGELDQKLAPWFEAVVDTVMALDGVGHAEARRRIDRWIVDGRLALEPVTYLRGRSLARTFTVLDEGQNLESAAARTILTRLGEGSKIVVCGDTTQLDNPWVTERTNALAAVIGRLEPSSVFGHITLSRGQRSAIADLAAERL